MIIPGIVAHTIVAAGGPAAGDYSFQEGVDGYTGNIDNRIDGDNATTNYSTDDTLDVDDNNFPLMKWDVSSLEGGTVSAADITVAVSNGGGNGAANVVELFEMLRDWVEDESTWNIYSTGNDWGTAGATHADDSGTTALFSDNMASTGATTMTLNASGIAVVQKWLDNAADNHGLIMRHNGSTNKMHYRSAKWATASIRPQLNITIA